MSETKRVLIVDDHPIVRHGLSQLIDAEPDLDVCGTAGTAEEGLRMAGELKPEVGLIDISLKDGNGIELIKEIRTEDKDMAILVISMHDEALYAERALKAGANGYITKQQADETVIDAIRKVLEGEMYITDELSAQMLRQYIGGAEAGESAGVERLTDRELEVFEWIGKGLSSQEIADKLDLSIKTIEVHRAHIKKKLELDKPSQVIQRAVQWVERQKMV
jgi:DNA-binding NarL/FixJ family response regulator